jgi:hypothetical protein
MNRKLIVIVAVLIIASIVAYDYLSAAPEPQGTINVSGAFALYPLMVKWADEYQKLHPKVKITVSAGGAGKGMTDALSGLVDIGRVSRDIAPEEIAKEVGADSVNYLSIEDYVNCTGLAIDKLCLGCITNRYPTPMADSLANQMWERVKRGEAETGRIYESIR